MNELQTERASAPTRSLIEIEAEIMAQKRTMGRSIVIIGQALIEAKGQLAHGAWGDWLREKVNFSQGTAENYMRIAEQVSGESMLLDLPYTKILALLSVPEEDREQFAQDNQVEDKSVSEIKRLVAELNKTRKNISDLMNLVEDKNADIRAEKQRADRAEISLDAARRNQEYLKLEIDRTRDRVAELEAREPDTVTIEREVPPEDYEEIKRENDRLNEALASTQTELEDMMDRYGDKPNPLEVVPFCDACAAFLNALYKAPYSKDFFETRSDAELKRYSDNIHMIYKWALDMQFMVDGIRADRLPDDGGIPMPF